jgi:peptidoglycan/LPS O-acetylase OafA/YrhL
VPKGWTLVSLMAVYFLFSQNFTTTYIGSLCLSPLWTLAVEEHFYLLAPVFVRRLTKRQFLTGVFALIAAAPLVRFLFYLHFHADPQWTWDGVVLPLDTWTFCRMDSLALGVGLAIAWETKRGRDFIKSHIRHFHIGLALFVALTAVSEYIQMKHIQSLYAAQQSLADTVLSLSSLCLIIIALADPKSWISSVLRWSWLRRLGRVGYCFYLIHWGVYWAMLRFAFHSELGRNLYLELALAPVCFAITWSLAELSWRWFEFPIIQFGRRYIPQPARPAAAHLAPVPSTT